MPPPSTFLLRRKRKGRKKVLSPREMTSCSHPAGSRCRLRTDVLVTVPTAASRVLRNICPPHLTSTGMEFTAVLSTHTLVWNRLEVSISKCSLGSRRSLVGNAKEANRTLSQRTVRARESAGRFLMPLLTPKAKLNHQS